VAGAFLFVTWSGGGNVNPVLAIARRLLDRGQRVRVLGSADLAPRFSADGVAFVPRDPDGEWDQSVMADDVLAEIDRAHTDVVVVDYMQPGALCGAEAAGRPTVALVHTLYGAMMHDGDLLTMYMAASTDGVNAVRRRLGLPEVARLGDLLENCARVIVTSPPLLDVVVDPLPDNVRYVGPMLEEEKVTDEYAGDLPLVVVSLGTTAMDEGPVLQRVLDAGADLPVRVVATVGDHLDPGAFTAPANATVRSYVPHSSLLPHAALLVNHAGLGGVLAALTYGVPMVCIPLGRDQPANAAAVERVGAGITLAPEASVDEIRIAIAEVIDDDRYRKAAAFQACGDDCVRELEALVK
jgi:MGT family glycosyltransferase